MTDADGQRIGGIKEISRDSEKSVSVSIIELIASISERDVDEVDPLYSWIDGEALDKLIGSDASVSISFIYDDFRVNVSDDETIKISIEDR